MSVSPRKQIAERDKRDDAQATEFPARLQRAPVSSDVADVAKRPKKRPGRRQRSSITTRRYALLMRSQAIRSL
jgi:hypothetical protein